LQLNKGRLRVDFVEAVIGTLLILRKGHNMGEVVWKRVSETFRQIDNV
jgi:hypothetical protein